MGLAMSEALWRFLMWWVRRESVSPELQGILHLYRRLRSAKGYMLSVESFGAKAPSPGAVRTISLSQIVRHSATPPWKGRLLYALTHSIRPERILELGTNIGFGTLYLAVAAPTAEIHTIEAAPSLAEKARQHFRLMGIKPKLHIGTFSTVLPTLSGEWDLIYIDGDHRGQALFEYTIQLYPRLRSGGLLICDDIFWSRDMYAGWRHLRQHLRVPAKVIGPFGLLYK